MKRGTGVIIFLILLSACGNKQQVPAGVLEPEKMESLLWDFMRADQFLLNFVNFRDTSVIYRDRERFRLYQEILDLHHLDQQTFRKSYTYYLDHPARLGVVMDSLRNREKPLPPDMVTPVQDSTAPVTPGQVNVYTDTAEKKPVKLQPVKDL